MDRHGRRKGILISEQDFNDEVRSSIPFPGNDTPGGRDVLENREILMGMSYLDEDPEDLEYDAEAPLSQDDLEADPSEVEARDEGDLVDLVEEG